MYILSIVIPTFNRAESLKRLLNNLMDEVSGLGEIEICISDNASEDNTKDIVDNFWKKIQKYENLKNVNVIYHRKGINEGYDKNVLSALLSGNGEYLWLVCDDDLIIEGSVKRLIEDLSNIKRDLGGIFINAKKDGDWLNDFYFKDFQLVYNETGSPLSISFAPCLIYHKWTLMEVIAKMNQNYPLKDFIHTYLWLECIKDKKLFAIEPLYGINIKGDGNKISYWKKLIVEKRLLEYVLEMDKYYLWFSESFLNISTFVRRMKILFVAGMILEQKPFLLKEEFDKLIDTYKRVLILKDLKRDLFIVDVYLFLLKIPFVLLPIHLTTKFYYRNHLVVG